jgi:O-antigen/teichoic acid export membrane protein
MGDNKQISKNIIYNSISFGINILISFFFTPYIIKMVGKEAYGFFPLVNNIIGYSSIVVSAISSMAGRFITIAYYENNKKETTQYFNSVLTAYIVISAIFTVIGLVAVFYINKMLTVPDYLLLEVQLLFLFALLTMILGLVTNIFSIGTYIKNRLDLSSMKDVLINIIRVSIILILFIVFRPSIVYMSLAAFCAAIVNVLCNLYLKKKLIPEIEINPKIYYSWHKIKEVTSSGIWVSINQLSNILNTTVDLLLTNIFISAMATGDYSIAKTVPSLIEQLGGMLAITFAPHFNILYAKKKYMELIKEINKSMAIMCTLLSFPIGFMLVNSDYFFKLWVPTAYSHTMYILSFVTILPIIVGAVTNPLFSVFTITNNRKVPALVLLVIGCFNMIIVYFLLKHTNLGVMAIAITSSVLLGLRNIIFTPIYGASCLHIKKTTFYMVLIKSIISVSIIAVVSFISRQFIEHITWLIFIIDGLIVLCISQFVNYYIVLNRNERKYIIEHIMKLKL